MDATINALCEILLKALPTFFLLIALHFYLKFTFFKPLEKVLGARYEATEGARKIAEQSLQRAAAKAAEYDAAIRAAKAEVYQEQERLYRELQDRRAAAVADARAAADAAVRAAQAELAAEVAVVKQSLVAESDMLANRIADSILSRRAA